MIFQTNYFDFGCHLEKSICLFSKSVFRIKQTLVVAKGTEEEITQQKVKMDTTPFAKKVCSLLYIVVHMYVQATYLLDINSLSCRLHRTTQIKRCAGYAGQSLYYTSEHNIFWIPYKPHKKSLLFCNFEAQIQIVSFFLDFQISQYWSCGAAGFRIDVCQKKWRSSFLKDFVT